MPFLRRVFLVIATTWAGATGALAQGPRADQARAAFTPDRLVRVRVDGRRMEGRVATLADSQVVLRDGVSEARIVLADVDTIWTARRATRKGALIGAGIGGVGLGAFAVLMVRGLCDSVDGCREDYLPAFVGWGALGAGGGAALGAGFGALVRTWERAWP